MKVTLPSLLKPLSRNLVHSYCIKVGVRVLDLHTLQYLIQALDVIKYMDVTFDSNKNMNVIKRMDVTFISTRNAARCSLREHS